MAPSTTTGGSLQVPTSHSGRTAKNSLVVTSIADQLYAILSERIVTGYYKPGQRLDMQAIADEHGVSRTPVRDALAELEFDRLIETRPRAGTFVATVGMKDIHEVCQLRKGIEWVATVLATGKISDEHLKDLRSEAVEAEKIAEAGDFEPFFASDTRLHQEIVAATGNARLVQARATVEPFVDWLRVLGATGTHRVAGSTKRHLEILDAMLAHDPVAAGNAAAVHLDEVEEWTAADMSAQGFS